MKTYPARTLFYFVLISFVLAIVAHAQDDATNKQLAKRVVQSAGVKKGDVVIIEGGKHILTMMEEMAIEVAMAGGFPVTLVGSDRVQRAIIKDTPDSYLEQVPTFWGEWYKHANVYIGLPGLENPKLVVQDIPEDRFARFSKNYEFFTGLINSLPMREVSINFPTKSAAENNGMEFEAYSKAIYDGINADYTSISQKGATLQKMLKSAKSIRVTTPAGTDLTFALVPNRSIFLDDGLITDEEGKSKVYTERFVALPGGSVYFAPLETSANGKVVIPRTRCRFGRYKDVSFELKNGKLTNLNASPFADCYNEEMRPYTGPKDMFGSVWIGLNPSLRNVENDKADLRHFNTGGMVHIGLGDNVVYGGANKTATGRAFPISNATVTVDGKVIVKDGALVF